MKVSKFPKHENKYWVKLQSLSEKCHFSRVFSYMYPLTKWMRICENMQALLKVALMPGIYHSSTVGLREFKAHIIFVRWIKLLVSVWSVRQKPLALPANKCHWLIPCELSINSWVSNSCSQGESRRVDLLTSLTKTDYLILHNRERLDSSCDQNQLGKKATGNLQVSEQTL